jgi:hypothetical protein
LRGVYRPVNPVETLELANFQVKGFSSNIFNVVAPREAFVIACKVTVASESPPKEGITAVATLGE